jgi:uncharacterized protein (TIGR03118 family)
MSKLIKEHACDLRPRFRRCVLWVRAIVITGALAGSMAAENKYIVHNLVSDLPNTADHQDANLVNPWGISFSATSPFWISNNHSGTSTLYDTSGTPLPLVVKIPTPTAGSGGAPTGTLFNGSQSFVGPNGKPANFIFCTEDGTIVGWNSGDQTQAKVLIDNSAAGAIYKGCTLGSSPDAPILYAADFHNGRIDAWGGDLKPIQNANAFKDPAVPAGFAPFNIQTLNKTLYVTYAKQDDNKKDDVPGAGNGYVSTFDAAGTLLKHLIEKGNLNSPWGVAIAPDGFGDFAGKLLVGNFGDGAINAFDAGDGGLSGTLHDTADKPIAIPGVWALAFGNGGRGGDPATLYFTAGTGGPNGEALETHGLFGSIQGAPSLQSSGVVNAASFTGTIAPNTWVSLMGGAFSATTRSWQTSDFTGNQLPTQLDNVKVTVNDKPAYISFISPKQINFLVPTDVATGEAHIKLSNANFTTDDVSVNVQPAAPSFFLFGGTKYIAATHADNISLLGPPNLITGATTTPAKPGETIVLYGNGFGVTNPAAPNGQTITTALPLATLPTVTIGGANAQVLFAGLSSVGLYQLNVVVPNGLPAGDAAVVAQADGMRSQDNAFISIAAQ